MIYKYVWCSIRWQIPCRNAVELLLVNARPCLHHIQMSDLIEFRLVNNVILNQIDRNVDAELNYLILVGFSFLIGLALRKTHRWCESRAIFF